MNLIYKLILCCCITSSLLAECRNSENCNSSHNKCVRCTSPSSNLNKGGGEITIMAQSSEPIQIYDNYNMRSCIPCSCGDDIHDEDEGCDDGNNRSFDGCNAACEEEYCGDAYINLPGEECDDGNSSNNDACVCRCNGVCEPGEKTVGKHAKCGDGFLYPVTEQCDKGEAVNGTLGSACSKDCLIDVCLGGSDSIPLLCGNNLKECSEACDLGANNGVIGSGCTRKCINECDDLDAKKLLCGNGKIDCDEECDDGNKLAGDGCGSTCRSEICGNGILDPQEQCDDSNRSVGDGCGKTCKLEVCGNNVIDQGEECDDGNIVDGDGCSKLCKPEQLLCNLNVCELVANVNSYWTHLTLTGTNQLNGTCKLRQIIEDSAQAAPEIYVNGPGSNIAWTQSALTPEYLTNFLTCPAGTVRQSCKFDQGTGPVGKIRCGCSIPLVNQSQVDALCGNGKIDCDEKCDDGELNGTTESECTNKCDVGGCVWITTTNSVSVSLGASTIWQTEKNVRSQVDNYEDIPSCFSQFWSSKCTINWWDEKDYFRQFSNDIVNYIDNNISSKGVLVYGGCDAAGQWNIGKFLADAPISQYHSSETDHYYFDQNCKYVSDEKIRNRPVCGFAGVSWSPLSLVLDEDAFVQSSNKVVKFQLSANPKDKYSVWKASAAAPLLVFDPNRTGRVESAEQLFGNWTFGGKQSAFQTVALQANKKSEPWSDGYEALSVLDYDGDGKISGRELDVLSLWFDANQDAVVNEGEIRTIAESGIKTLYYRGAVQGSGRDLNLRVGFEREHNGKTVKGRSIDWYGESFESLKSASDALTSINNTNDSIQPKTEVYAKKDRNPLEFKPGVVDQKDYNKDVSGFWIWSIEGDKKGKQPGLLAIKQHADDSITGYTVAEAKLSKNSANLNSTVGIIPIKGKVTRKAGKISLEFEAVIDEKGGNKVHSVVQLTHDGKILVGETTQLFGVSKAKNGEINNSKENVELKYRWVAGRS